MTDQLRPPQQGTSPLGEDAKTLQMLVQLLLAERQEALLEKQSKLAHFAERDKQRRINAEFNAAEKQQSWTLCTHKKGGRSGPKSPKVDYAVYFHTFVDGNSYIRCQICGMKWKNTDTKDTLIRRGKAIQNFTGIGWKEAHEMLSQSTNTPTSSEVMINTSPIARPVLNFETNPREVEI
jgi:hypothetical protein